MFQSKTAAQCVPSFSPVSKSTKVNLLDMDRKQMRQFFSDTGKNHFAPIR